MEKFDNVSVVCKANTYFSGAVSSRTVLFADGTRKTLGVMLGGEYEFSTAEKEIVEILDGAMEVKLPDTSDWKLISLGESFEVPANSTFQVRIESLVDYCCSYLSE